MGANPVNSRQNMNSPGVLTYIADMEVRVESVKW